MHFAAFCRLKRQSADQAACRCNRGTPFILQRPPKPCGRGRHSQHVHVSQTISDGADIQRLTGEGLKPHQIAAQLNIGVASVYRYC